MLRRSFAAAATAATLATLTGIAPDARAHPAAPAADAGGPPADPFFGYTRPATYDVVREDVRVPVRDGNRLACQLYRPGTSATTPASGEFPGIVYEFTAYASNAEAFGEGASHFVERGYNALVCQVRGSGESPGELDPFSPQEHGTTTTSSSGWPTIPPPLATSARWVSATAATRRCSPR